MVMYGLLFGLVLLTSGCAKEKTKDTMTRDELTRKAQSYIKQERYEDAIPYVAKLVTRFPDDANIAKYKILLAELHFKDAQYAGAKDIFESFTQYYPSDKRSEYAKYKTIVSSFYQTLPADRDQTYTEETVKLCGDYLSNLALQKYRTSIQDILKSCNERLLDKEIYVFNFYLSKKKFDAARGRIKQLKEKFVASNKTLEPRVLYLEYKLAMKEKKSEQAKLNLKKLMAEYPQSPFATMAQALDSKPLFFF